MMTEFMIVYIKRQREIVSPLNTTSVYRASIVEFSFFLLCFWGTYMNPKRARMI